MYLRVSSNGATTSSTSYSLTNAAPAKPYLQIQTGTTKWYLPLTTATVAGTRLSIKSGTSTYRPLVYSTYKTTSTAVGNMSSTTALTKVTSVYYNTSTWWAMTNRTIINRSNTTLGSLMYTMTNASYTECEFWQEHSGVGVEMDIKGMSNNNFPSGFANVSHDDRKTDTFIVYKDINNYTNTQFVTYANGFTYTRSYKTALTSTISVFPTRTNTSSVSTTINRTAVPWVSFTTRGITTLKLSSTTYTGSINYTTNNATYNSNQTDTLTLFLITGYGSREMSKNQLVFTRTIYTNSQTNSAGKTITVKFTGGVKYEYIATYHSLFSTQNTQTFSTNKTTTAYSGVSSKWA